MKNRVITIDIETLPAESEIKLDLQKTAKQNETDVSKTALNGDFGRILCIGYIDEKPNGQVNSGVIGWDNQKNEFNKMECEILAEFWQMMSGFRPIAIFRIMRLGSRSV